MDLLKNRFLLWPVVLLGALLCVDKIFLLSTVREYTSHYMKIEDMFYESRRLLLPDLIEDYHNRSPKGQKLGIILGTSRSSEFSTHEIAKHIPNSYTYNFSAPQAGHSYHAYWLDQILKSGARPSFIILESGAIPLGDNTNRFPLTHSMDPAFMWKHLELFPESTGPDWHGGGFSTDDFERYVLNRMFASYRFPMDLRAARQNHEEQVFPDPVIGARFLTGIEIRRKVTANMDAANHGNLGGIPNPHTLELPEHLMQRDAEAVSLQHLPRPYRPGRSQAYFLRFMVELAAREKIPMVIYWPPVVSQFTAIKEKIGASQQADKGIATITEDVKKKYPGAHIAVLNVDADAPMKCRIFFDAIHIAGRCYPELTEKITQALKSQGPI